MNGQTKGVGKHHRVEPLLWLVVVIWAGNYTISKVGLRELPPLVFASLRFALAAPFMAGLLLWRQGQLKIPREDLPRVILVGLVGIALYQYIFNAALKYASVTTAALGLGLSPIFTVLLGAAFGHEKLRGKTLAGSLIAFTGLSLVIIYGPKQPDLSGHPLLGDALAVATGFLWGLYPILVTPLLKRHSALWVTSQTSLIGALALVIYSGPALLATDWPALSWPAWLSLAYAALPVTVVALVAWSHGIGRIGANQAMVYTFLSIPAAMVMAAMFLGESLTWPQAVGAVVTIYGVYLVKKPPNRGHRQTRFR